MIEWKYIHWDMVEHQRVRFGQLRLRSELLTLPDATKIFASVWYEWPLYGADTSCDIRKFSTKNRITRNNSQDSSRNQLI